MSSTADINYGEAPALELSPSVRAKFTVHSITTQKGWNQHKEIHTVKLMPVTGGSAENSSFYAATPGGSIELSYVNPEIGRQFGIGDEFYVDFVKA